MNQEINNPTPEKHTTKIDKIKRFAAGVLVVIAVAGGIEELRRATALKYSDSTRTVRVRANGTIWDAAKHVEGYNSADPRDIVKHIKDMEANQEVLSDGLQAGEPLEIPESIKH